MSLHADAVLAAIEAGCATSLIAASWRRSARLHRIDPDDAAGPAPDGLALRLAEERNAALIATARPYLDQLFAALADPLGSVTLVDETGLMIAMRTGPTHDVYESGVRHWLGSNVGEKIIGTNGNGTCLAEERPVVVSGSDHFLSALTHTVCIAAPIFGPDGALLGCLNALTSAAHRATQRFEGLAHLVTRGLAQRIEAELFAAAFPATRLVLAAPGRHPAALLSVDCDGVIVGATRAARRLLAIEARDLADGLDLDGLGGMAGSPASIAEAERTLIARALAAHGGNVSAAARSLGISRSTLYRRGVGVQRHG